MTTNGFVFSTLFRSGGMGAKRESNPKASWPYAYCRKHQVHHGGDPEGWNYCVYMDPIEGPKQRERDRLLDRDVQLGNRALAKILGV